VDARRGAAFIDPTTTDPYLVFVAEFSLVRLQGESIHNRLVALKVNHRGRFELYPVEHFLLLRGCDRFPSEHVSLAARAAEIELLAGEFLQTNVAAPLLAERLVEIASA